jgi:hypothetical protein
MTEMRFGPLAVASNFIGSFAGRQRALKSRSFGAFPQAEGPLPVFCSEYALSGFWVPKH